MVSKGAILFKSKANIVQVSKRSKKKKSRPFKMRKKKGLIVKMVELSQWHILKVKKDKELRKFNNLLIKMVHCQA